MKSFDLAGRLLSTFALAGLMLAGVSCGKTPSATPGSAIPVVAADVLVQDTTNYLESIGQTFGAEDVEIRARVAGFLDSVHFSEGRAVASNDLLYVIDPKPFEATLEQARGVLAEAMANWERSRRDTNRLGQLYQQDILSSQEYEYCLAAEQAAGATVKSAKAAVGAAEIQLGYTRITSPIDGIVGRNEVSVGNLVGQGQSTLLTTISDISSIKIRFSISEQDYLKWRREYKGEEIRSNIFELILADGSLHGHRNSDFFADRQVDPRTGTLMVQVLFPNPDRIVRPGQFARVRFPTEVFPNAVLVPQRAVQEIQANYSVFVVSAENQAEFRKITVGPRIGTFFVIRDGLKPGEKIVIDGIQKLQAGVPVAATFTNLVFTKAPAP